MPMCKKMFFTILVIAIALGAVAKGHSRIGKLCPSAYRTLVLADTAARPGLGKRRAEFLLTLFLFSSKSCL